jgi:hypothetical protein
MKVPKVASAGEINPVSADLIGELFGVSRQTFAQWIKDGIIERQPPSQGYDLRIVCRAVFEHYRKIAAGRGGEDHTTLIGERTRLVAAKRRIAERQDQLEAGQVAQIEPIVRFLQGQLLAMRDRLLNLPGQLAFVLAGRDQIECFEAIDSAVREALEEIAAPSFPSRAAAAGLEGAKGKPRNDEDEDGND